MRGGSLCRRFSFQNCCSQGTVPRLLQAGRYSRLSGMLASQQQQQQRRWISDGVSFSSATHGSLFDESYGFFFRAAQWRPHPEKEATGGEDAFMATDTVLGVGDGVGWWGQIGGGSASQQYSETFMREAFRYCEEDCLGGGSIPVLDVVRAAFEGCRDVAMGSMTALLASVVGRTLEVYNMGDCTLLLIRNGRVVFQTEEMLHGLNFPFQLGVGSKDKPEDGVVTCVPVRPGDIVVMGSDGVFDNVFEHDILRILNQLNDRDPSTRLLGLAKSDEEYELMLRRDRASASHRAASGVYAQQLLTAAASLVIKLASENANDPRADTPFASKCVMSGAYHEGGKLDDMTLVMATITPSLVAEGIRFGMNDTGDVPPPYKNWP